MTAAEAMGLKRLRRRALLSRQELADKVEVSAQSIWAWESGYSWPRVEHIRKLAEVLGVEISVVLDALEESIKKEAVA